MITAIQQHRLTLSLTTGSQPLPMMQALQESLSDKPTVSRKPNNPGKYPGLNLVRHPDQANNRLLSPPPRHPGEGRDPETTGTDWIPASAGMTRLRNRYGRLGEIVYWIPASAGMTMRGCRNWTMREGCLRLSCLRVGHQ
jgi:hypothetical protein